MLEILFWLLTLAPMELLVLSVGVLTVSGISLTVCYSLTMAIRQAFDRMVDAKHRRDYWKAQNLRHERIAMHLKTIKEILTHV
jgi:hypothetical protein